MDRDESAPTTPAGEREGNPTAGDADGGRRIAAGGGRRRGGRNPEPGERRPTDNGPSQVSALELWSQQAVRTDEFEPLAESVRYILARPQVSIEADLPPRIAVVSAMPGEGVSTLSRVFASVLSHDSHSTACHVDLSWDSTSLPGVYEVAKGECTLDDALVWDGPSASLPSGGVGRSERHQLARSEELDKVIATLTSRFEHVVMDMPAILSGSDGLSMMRLADAYLLVVKHGVTTLQQVQSATSQLSHVASLGSMLNQVRTRTPRPLSRWLAG